MRSLIPIFANYNGENIFRYNEDIFCFKKILGSGCNAQAQLFATKNGKQCVVKVELASVDRYCGGRHLKEEASWYEKVYGLGVYSGNTEDDTKPHYLLMPYFPGETLHYIFLHAFWEEGLQYWLKTACEIDQLHTQHHLIHGDVTLSNIIGYDRRAFLIDFGLATPIGLNRGLLCLPKTIANRSRYSQYAPELFDANPRQSKFATVFQDIYSLGILLFVLLHFHPECTAKEMVQKTYIGLTNEDPRSRYTIAQSIYLIAGIFVSSVPRVVTTDTCHFSKKSTAEMCALVWKALAIEEIAARTLELHKEQNTLQNKKRGVSRKKKQKIHGLLVLFDTIGEPSNFHAQVKQIEKHYPKLRSGFFQTRTKEMLNRLEAVGMMISRSFALRANSS
ncbi:MAG: hypothetical protein A3I77_01110 [Gammaproteobacteria bacterium RIFCSPLOWO2_02_FULL_42_14]|nr:MAG: hypothetical protein A3B71_01475 [Gammaproteobacteria bacterium RIFCSPHIGHO2_02_FULL_42_43]OGT27363.1 MAG: hypothetical protein A2624_04890 [Gammaproteobacteria bacterium RIFCSPHIGHO2_01_FULL_42_8]OGT52651.1 MAG: hypothetical protein A3E54_07170 [Gammaproteobacteria bacterium RIFCSPHIGHO2_12_FULL_41_25]OGT62890.1 MAG: hypothetical protein A3I77_01110 [Gammaproteobacteria bacterium RIFCSPLOWO2_02_FULL_42_14]OGT86938.1 MAG: hypothetical protein A3G86_06345 [Gammaproteobacteria bacterium R